MAVGGRDRRVVITGMGAVSPLGNDVDSLWRGCLDSRSGVSQITSFDASHLPCRIAGEASDFRPTDWLSAKAARRLPRFAQFAVVAADQAVAAAGLRISDEDPNRVGVVLGNGSGGTPQLKQHVLSLVNEGWDYCDPLALLKTLSDIAATTLSARLGTNGYISTIAASCASSAIAIGHAADVIRAGRADVVVAGGTEAWITEMGIVSFALLRALSSRNEEPERASRPFDVDRDGFVPAEGAAILVLEEWEHARQRGVVPLAELKGFGVSSDAGHPIAPRADGISGSRAISNALAEASLAPADLDYVNAHGTSTQLNDSSETRALEASLGEAAGKIPVSATKSMIGHSLGAAAAIEMVICVKTIQDSAIHPTANLDSVDPNCQLNHVIGKAERRVVNNVLNVSFGFGGQNACLVVGRPTDDR